MKVQQTQPRSVTTSHDPMRERLLVISRYVENIRRLARLADLPQRARHGNDGGGRLYGKDV